MIRKRQVAILCFGDASGDPRPSRIIGYLLHIDYDVTVISDYHPPNKELTHIKLGYHWIRNPSNKLRKLIKLGFLFLRKVCYFQRVKAYLNRFLYGYKTIQKQLLSKDFDLIICHDIYLLDLAIAMKNNKETNRLIFDAREFYPRQFETSLFFKFFEMSERDRLCENNLKLVDELFTISEGIAELYQYNYGVKPKVMMSAPYYRKNIKIRETDKKRIKIVHHGVANRNRQIEKMIEIVSNADTRFHLDLYLTGDEIYRAELLTRANSSRVRILDPVPYDKLIDTLSNYDIGMCYIEPETINLKYCLPNKFFEFIQARLAIFIGPTIEMKKILENHSTGLVCSEFSVSTAVRYLNSIRVTEIDRQKNKSSQLAEIFSFEYEISKMRIL